MGSVHSHEKWRDFDLFIESHDNILLVALSYRSSIAFLSISMHVDVYFSSFKSS